MEIDQEASLPEGRRHLGDSVCLRVRLGPM